MQSTSRSGKDFINISASFGKNGMNSTQSSNPLLSALGLSFRDKMLKMIQIRKEEEKRQEQLE